MRSSLSADMARIRCSLGWSEAGRLSRNVLCAIFDSSVRAAVAADLPVLGSPSRHRVGLYITDLHSFDLLHGVLLQRLGISYEASARRDLLPSQAASWNSSAMNAAWALISLPPMLRTCPFLIIAIAS